jgi:hypothetical protein
MNDNINKSLERSQKCINVNVIEDQLINNNNFTKKKNHVDIQLTNSNLKANQKIYESQIVDSNKYNSID